MLPVKSNTTNFDKYFYLYFFYNDLVFYKLCLFIIKQISNETITPFIFKNMKDQQSQRGNLFLKISINKFYLFFYDDLMFLKLGMHKMQ